MNISQLYKIIITILVLSLNSYSKDSAVVQFFDIDLSSGITHKIKQFDNNLSNYNSNNWMAALKLNIRLDQMIGFSLISGRFGLASFKGANIYDNAKSLDVQSEQWTIPILIACTFSFFDFHINIAGGWYFIETKCKTGSVISASNANNHGYMASVYKSWFLLPNLSIGPEIGFYSIPFYEIHFVTASITTTIKIFDF